MRRMRDWLRRGVVPVVLTVACLFGLIGAAIAATAPTLPEVVLAQSGHWAVDKSTGSVVHVHGGTRQVDARVALPADAADARTALQGDTQGFVVGRDRAWAFDKATLTVDPPIPLPAADETPVGIETPGGPYLVYRGRGTIVRLGAPTAVVEAGGPVGPPVHTPRTAPSGCTGPTTPRCARSIAGPPPSTPVCRPAAPAGSPSPLAGAPGRTPRRSSTRTTTAPGRFATTPSRPGPHSA